MSILTQTQISPLTPREAVIDAVLRFVNGLDEGDRTLVESAFTDNVTFDLTPLSSIGVPYGVTSGKVAVVDSLMKSVGDGMDNQHNVTNSRVHIHDSGREADFSACVIAQHYRRGEGVKLDSKWLMMGTRYVAKLKKDEGEDGLWRIETFELGYRWADGDLGVITGH